MPTDNSGDPLPGTPGQQGLGQVAQGFVEASNVQLIEEFVNLIVAQRAYEASSKAIQASDEMLSISNNLRR
jgi:flagellar basal-body rod protein FlgG